MIRFVLNDQLVNSSLPAGMTMLDFVRYHKRLSGTKIGCREGDCGACTVLVGSLENEQVIYRSMTSCLMPIANAAGKHIVTVEGINMNALSPVQQAMVDCNGTQCGFCTPGFVMSLTGFVMNESVTTYQQAIESIDGNICRCTGYKSIERAAAIITSSISNRSDKYPLKWLVENNFIPDYFLTVKERLIELSRRVSDAQSIENDHLLIAGGTDLNVQKHTVVKSSALNNLFDRPNLKGISIQDGRCYIGASVTVTDFSESPLICDVFPNLKKHIKLVSSMPIRNMATLAGNIVNASPIGDMSIFLLALDAELVLNCSNVRRIIKLKDFYKGYKQLELMPTEIIEQIIFDIPSKEAAFSFEKVCKRTHLDIASVNTACLIQLDEDQAIKKIHLSAGGVAPFPKYLKNTCAFLLNKKLDAQTLKLAVRVLQEEVTPISDARGTIEYKRLLLRQLFLAHFDHHNKKILGETLQHI